MKECPQCKTCFPDTVSFCHLDGARTIQSIPGEPTLDGRYLLEKRIGQGGCGIVFKARHVFMKSSHAIKVILPDLVGNDPMLVTRFRQVCLAAAAIRHKNVVAVTDFGVSQGTMPFLVMEFVSGKSLHDMLAEQGPMPPHLALEILMAIAAGVGAAHKQNIIHRDLKPNNIIIQEGMSIAEGLKILDFGLAEIKSGELLGSFVQANTTGLLGSPFYMAPEEWADEEPDARADIYSLGVILYQMVCGDVPFKGSTIPAIMSKHLMAPVPSFQSVGINVDQALEAVVRHALEKEPASRPQTTAVFVSELEIAYLRIVSPPLGWRPPMDENVQFTVYRPRAIEPHKWYSMLAYAHLSERRPNAPAGTPHPKAEVERKAREALKEVFRTYTDVLTDSEQAIPQEGVLTFVPVFDGIEFVPPHHVLLWQGPVHELEFKMQAAQKLEGQTCRGHLRIYLGVILVAEVSIAISVNTQKAREFGEAPSTAEDPVACYRKIFASYSHKDEPVVCQFEQLVQAFGDEYLRDVRDIRAGEVWSVRLEELIREADVFQLFWSTNSMRSSFVQAEWEYALKLNRSKFIRPTFWEVPMPQDETLGLPPARLLSLQFKRVPVAGIAQIGGSVSERDSRRDLERERRQGTISVPVPQSTIPPRNYPSPPPPPPPRYTPPTSDAEILAEKIPRYPSAGNTGALPTVPGYDSGEIPRYQTYPPPASTAPRSVDHFERKSMPAFWIILPLSLAILFFLGVLIAILWWLLAKS